MASLFQKVKGCIIKTPISEQVEVITDIGELDEGEGITESEIENIKEDDSASYKSDKKTDERKDPGSEGGILWRVSAGLYNSTATAVGYSVGSVKWVAEKGYDVGTSVASHVKVPSMQSFKRKDKKE